MDYETMFLKKGEQKEDSSDSTSEQQKDQKAIEAQ